MDVPSLRRKADTWDTSLNKDRAAAKNDYGFTQSALIQQVPSEIPS